MQPSIFVNTEPNVFQPFNEQGSGFESIDQFISDRVALMSDDDEWLRNLNHAQQNVKQLNHDQLRDYISGLTNKAFDKIAIGAINSYSEKGDVEGGVRELENIKDAADQETEVRRLANASAHYLEQFPPYSYAREQARRQYAAVMMAKQLEQFHLTPDTWGKKAKALLGSFIPGRRVFQEVTADTNIYENIRQMHHLSDEEFLQQLPDVMDEVLKISGGNPFMFMERMEAYLSPDDVAYLKAFFLLDAVDAATIVASVTKFMKLGNLVRATNTPIKILRDSSQVAKAAELNAAALSDDAAASALRTTKADAASSTSPFGGEGVDPDITEVIAAETQAIIAERQVVVGDILKPLHDENFLIHRQFWTPEEKAKAQAKYLSKFAGKAVVKEQFDDGFLVEVEIQRPDIWPKKAVIEQRLLELRDLKAAYKKARKDAPKSTGQKDYLDEMVQQTRDEINRYEMILERIAHRVDDAPRPVVVETVQVKYVNNDYGEMFATEYSKANRFLTSPSTTIEQLSPGAVNAASKIDYDTARVVDIFLKARNAALKGLNKKKRKALDSVLLQGDRDGVVYSDMQLVKGVRTKEGLIQLDTAEQLGAYRSIRDIHDTLFELKNKELFRELELGGFKAVFPTNRVATYADDLGDTTAENLEAQRVTNFVNPNKVIPQEDISKIKRIYNFATDSVEDVGRINAEDVLDWKIYELKYPLEVGDEIINYAVAKPTHIKPLPRYVLNKRVGYIPKIDKNIFWVVEMVGDKMVNGVVKTDFRRVNRFFDNPLDAQIWANDLRAKGVRNEVRSGREWLDDAPGRREEFEAQIFGGLYGGQRHQGNVPFGLDGTEAERLGGVEAMEAYMNHIATRMPAVNFRSSLIQRFLNSAVNPADGKSYLKNPGDWRSELIKNMPPERRSALTAMQNWISDQVRIPTTEERVWGNLQQSIAKSVMNVPGAGRTLSKWAMQIGAKDITAQMRGLAFHATLGWLNPAQLFVQAMGASLAMSVDPIQAPFRMRKALAIRAAMFGQSEDGIRKVATAAMIDEDDFLRMTEAYRRTGLHEATLSTGDYAALQGLPDGYESLRYLANKGLIFFREGERFARNYAWIQAYEEVTKGMKFVKGQKLPDNVIDMITDRHFHYTLNLTRANRAFWQKGLLSIPTQFWQISAKFIENMLPNFLVKTPNGWTGKEKSMILMGQVALFGAAGIPYGTSMTSSLINWISSDDDYGLGVKDEQAQIMLQGGLTELMLYNWTGGKLDITNRLSIPAGIEQMIEIMTSDNKTTADLVFGVSGELGSRTWQAIKLNSMILYSIADSDEASFDADVARDVVDNVAQIVSSWKNYQKARLWERLQYVPDRNGNRIFEIDDENQRAILFAQKIGIAPKDLDNYYSIRNVLRSKDEELRDAAVGVIQIGQRYMNDPDMIVNKNKQARMKAEINILLMGFPEGERQKILMQVNERMKRDGYLLPEAMEKALDMMYLEQGTNSSLQINSTLVNGE